MKHLILFLLTICTSSIMVAQSEELLTGKFWYVKSDSIVEPEDITLIDFSSTEPDRPYCMWRFDEDGKLGLGSRMYHGDGGGTFVRNGAWRIKGNVLRIGSMKFRILGLTENHLVLEKK